MVFWWSARASIHCRFVLDRSQIKLSSPLSLHPVQCNTIQFCYIIFFFMKNKKVTRFKVSTKNAAKIFISFVDGCMAWILLGKRVLFEHLVVLIERESTLKNLLHIFARTHCFCRVGKAKMGMSDTCHSSDYQSCTTFKWFFSWVDDFWNLLQNPFDYQSCTTFKYYFSWIVDF